MKIWMTEEIKQDSNSTFAVSVVGALDSTAFCIHSALECRTSARKDSRKE